MAQHLDHLLDLVQERDRQLRSWNEELNTRVEERTRAPTLTVELPRSAESCLLVESEGSTF